MKNTKTQTAAESKAQLISLNEELARLRKKGRTWTKQKKIQKAIDKLNGEVIADEERALLNPNRKEKMKNTTSQTKVPSLIKLELTREELNDIRELLDEKLHHAETAVAMAERDGNQDGYENGQHDVCKFEDLALAFADVSIITE